MPSTRGHHQRYKWPWWGVGISPASSTPMASLKGLCGPDGPVGLASGIIVSVVEVRMQSPRARRGWAGVLPPSVSFRQQLRLSEEDL